MATLINTSAQVLAVLCIGYLWTSSVIFGLHVFVKKQIKFVKMRTNVLFSFFFCFLCNTNNADAAFMA